MANKNNTSEVAYGKTLIGKIIYDLAFVTLSDKWISKKYSFPIAHVRQLRIDVNKAVWGKRNKPKEKP